MPVYTLNRGTPTKSGVRLRHSRWLVGVLLLLGLSAGCQTTAQTSEIDLSSRLGIQEMVVSVKFLDDAIETYRAFADYQLLHRGDATSSQALQWGMPADTRIEQAVLRAPGTDLGFLRLVKFHGVDQVRIRSSARPFDTGGIFNLNMRAKDLEASFEDMRDRGFAGFADPTYYDFKGSRYGGAMIRGHDGVVINLLTRVSGDYSGLPPFERVSHVINSTQMVGNFEAYEDSKAFFRDQLGWHLRFEGSPGWPEDGANNMGLPHSLIRQGAVAQRAAGFVFAEGADGGSIEIFAFDGIEGKDFSDRAVAPNLGVLMYRAHVSEIDAYAATLASRGVPLVSPLTNHSVAPYGAVRSFIVKAPSGAWIEFFQQL